MKRVDGQPILTAAQMRAAEQRAIDAGASVQGLMERAGAGVAEAAFRFGAGAEVLVLCGPGNNGGDGYVAARVLRERGVAVRVATTGEPGSAAAVEACARWGGPVEMLAQARPAPVVVDALFGTGLSRAIDPDIADPAGALLGQAGLAVAVDLPSHMAADDGRFFNEWDFAPVKLTLALGALKPSHLLMPAAGQCGTVRVLDIGINDHLISPEAPLAGVVDRPGFLLPDTDSHKYSRGLVIVIAGAMPGAARLAAEAAARAGAGYVMLMGDTAVDAAAHAIVRRPWSREGLAQALAGKDNAIVVVGPGLGRDDLAREKLEAAIGACTRLVIDGDALHLLEPRHFERFAAIEDGDGYVALTPHAGEFRALFGDWTGSKIDAARAAAVRAGATVVFKGADTVIAGRDRYVLVAPGASHWLSTAGTGDVLAGAIAAAIGNVSFYDEAAAGVWMHSEAARRLGGSFIADDLARELSKVRAAL